MKRLFAFFAVIFIGALLLPSFSDAEKIIPCGGCKVDLTEAGQCPLGEEQPSCGLCHIFELLNNVITFLLIPSSFNGGAALVLIAAAVLFALGGFFIFVAAGNTGRLEQGKKIIISTIVGLFIVYISYVFVSLLLQAMGVMGWTGLGTWWQITC